MREKRLGEILVAHGVLDESQVQQGLEKCRLYTLTLGQALVIEGLCSEEQIADALAEKFGLEHVSLEGFQVDATLLNRVRHRNVERLRSIPLGIEECDGVETLIVATSHPEDLLQLDEIRATTGLPIMAKIASESDVSNLLKQIFGHDTTQSPSEMGVIDMAINQYARGDAETLLLQEGEIPAIYHATTAARVDRSGELSVESIAHLSEMAGARTLLTQYPPLTAEQLDDALDKLLTKEQLAHAERVGGITLMHSSQHHGRHRITVQNCHRSDVTRRNDPGLTFTLRFDRVTGRTKTPVPRV
jgi:MshEN domain